MLQFDINASELRAISDALGASEKQFKLALSAAIKRTVTSLRTLAARGLRDELQLRKIGLLRKRLKTAKIKFGTDGGMQLWFGLNDMPVSWFKGRPKQEDTGASMRGQKFEGAFVGKSAIKGRNTIFKRKTKARLHIEEQNLAVEEKAKVFVEDNIFTETETLFWKYFEREIAARVKYNIGAR